ncbi:MAG: galactokinase [Treponema sp.]|nr:galactokinase [Treponema sp.]
MKALNDAHVTEYGGMPDVVAKAPGRFHLIGEHSWFFKDKTLSMAVDIPVYVAITKRDDSVLRFYFHQLSDRKRANVSSLKFKKEDKWANAVKSVIYGYVSGGFNVEGMDITIYSDILPSSGFGITTAIKAASLLAIKELFSIPCTEVQMLQVLERGNRRFLKINNYIADNYSALFSKKESLILTDYSRNSWDYIPYSFEGKKIFLIDTKVPRVSIWNEETLFEPEYALILGDMRERKQSAYGGWQYISNVTDINEELSTVSEDIRRKLLCIMREHGDVLDAKDALEKIDFFKFARTINHSHESLRDMYNLSCPEIEWIFKRISELEPNLELITNPVSCGRITGKGFGRCLYAVIRESDEEKFRAQLTQFEKIFGYHPEIHGVQPADGACILRD